MPTITDHVVFNDKKLAQRYVSRPIPISVLYEAYFDGDIDIPGDMMAFLRQRNLFVKYTLTPQHLRWMLTNFVPEVAIQPKKSTGGTTSSAGSWASAWSIRPPFSSTRVSRSSRRRTTR